MANNLNNTTFTMLGMRVLQAFVTALTPLNAFSRNYSPDAVGKGDKVKVLFVDAQDEAREWAGSYVIDDADAEGLDISINKRAYVSWGLTTEELRNNPQVSLETFADQKGFRLAKYVLQDIWSLAKADPFGAPIFTGPAANLDSHDVADIESTLDDAFWPTEERSLILKPTYHGSIVKDSRVEGNLGVEGSQVISNSRVPRIHNFDLHKSAVIPANGENLVGMAVHPDSILVAMRLLEPEEVAKKTIVFQSFTHEQTGIIIAYREWFDADADKVKRVFEVSYGRRVGNTAGLKRFVSA